MKKDRIKNIIRKQINESKQLLNEAAACGSRLYAACGEDGDCSGEMRDFVHEYGGPGTSIEAGSHTFCKCHTGGGNYNNGSETGCSTVPTAAGTGYEDFETMNGSDQTGGGRGGKPQNTGRGDKAIDSLRLNESQLLKEQTTSNVTRQIEHCDCNSYDPTTNKCMVMTTTGLQLVGPGPNGGDFFNMAMLPVGGNSVTQVGTDYVPPQPGDRMCTTPNIPGGYVNTGNIQDCQAAYSSQHIIVSVIGPKNNSYGTKNSMKVVGNYCGAPWLNPVDGCTDFNALNYDINASQDDGSCDYGWECKSIRNHRKFGSTCVTSNAQNPGTYQTKQDCISSGCEPVRADNDDKTLDPITDDESIIDCLNNPTEECWVCHWGANQTGTPSSCIQLTSMPPNWITNTGIPNGFNFYNTESDCMSAGSACIDLIDTGNPTKDNTIAIAEDMQIMKRIIKY